MADAPRRRKPQIMEVVDDEAEELPAFEEILVDEGGNPVPKEGDADPDAPEDGPDEAAPAHGPRGPTPPPSSHADHMELLDSTPLRPTWAAWVAAAVAALLLVGLVVALVAALTADGFRLWFGTAAVLCGMFSGGLLLLLFGGRARTLRRIAVAHFDVKRTLSTDEAIQGDLVRVRLDAGRCSWPEGLVVRLRERPVPGFETGRPVVLSTPEIRDYSARAQRRGRQAFEAVEVLVRDEVGLWEHTRVYRLEDWVEVRPGLSALQLRNMLSARAPFPDGAPKALVNLFRDVEHDSLREYSPGDRLKDVDWKRMAITQQMMVRQTTNESLDVGLLLIDAGASMRLVEKGHRNLDTALEAAAEIIQEGARRNHQVGFVAFDETRVVEEMTPTRARTMPIQAHDAFQRLADRRPPARTQARAARPDAESTEPLAVSLQRVLRRMVGARMGILLLSDLETVDEGVVQVLSRLGGSGAKVGALVLAQPSMDAKRDAYRRHGVRPPKGYRGRVHRRELREVLSVQGIETMDLVA